MFEIFDKLVGTIALRPYVFVFLAFYLAGLIRLFGARRALIFHFTCWIIAFLSEFSSTRNGFPYGLYHYIEDTRGLELWITNVPFMDSLSYTFLQFCGLSMALFALYPNYKGSLQLPNRLKNPWTLSALAAFFVTFSDIIIDPIAHQGEKWFLGKIYYYPNPGAYFDVPLSNFLGWFLVSLLSLRLYFYFESLLPERKGSARAYQLPYGDLLGVGLYLGVVLFNIAVTWYIGDMQLLFTDIYIMMFGLIPYALLVKRQSLARKIELVDDTQNSQGQPVAQSSVSNL